MSQHAKRLGYIQIFLFGSIITMIGIFYVLLYSILSISPELLNDPAYLEQLAMELVEQHMNILSIAFIAMLVALVSGIMYLVSFFQLASSFTLLAKAEHRVSKLATSVSNLIRISIVLQLAGISLPLITGVGLIYLPEILLIFAFALITVAYFNIAKTFNQLRQIGMFPKKESKLLFYFQLIPLLSVIPLSFSVSELTSGINVTLTPLIIAAIIIIGGTIGVAIGFFRLSSDALLIAADFRTEYDSNTQTIYMEQEVKPQYLPEQELVDSTEIEAKFCPHCGVKIRENKKFCTKCGSNVEA
ncbi:MAG: zinc-ribbon domain-containing protein [Candidatus Heimdallarchaeota archaeon]|nr:zinc-ribbon domain-containing protein [Candidatus Heimdallarchaeota archaeon]MCG3255423.1 zinc-ribbon domain-containing protein [Candidatus Heimdallarchaeota archaeon]MCK4610496.1 zinc-ribbon domain-containing protein [Candidatus Heimdallarchaeota archaeon]